MRILLMTFLACLGSVVDSLLPDSQRFDCAPDIHEDNFKDECEKRGCVYTDEVSGPLAPKCFYPESWKNYEVLNSYSNPDDSIVVLLKKTQQETGFPKNSQLIKLDVTIVDEARLRIKVTDATQERWEVPIPVLNIPSSEAPSQQKNRLYSHFFKDGVLSITRAANGKMIFESDITELIFSDQFLQMIIRVPSNELMGLGEQVDHHVKRVETASDGKAGRKDLNFHNFGDHPLREKPVYGHHPFYLMFDDNDGTAHGVYFRNSNPMDVVMTSTPALTFRTIGGVLDFFLFLGPSADDVIRQKTELMGFTPLPPYWALGFHLCRYGYKDDKEITTVYERNTKTGLPQDVQWADIDYMDTFNMFTLDKKNFPNLPNFVKRVHADGRHFVPILDPSFDGSEDQSSSGYPLYKSGVEKDIFVKNPAGGLVRGRVWNTAISVFPDFTHPKCKDWWNKNIKDFHEVLEFDGLWIDMNEPATFISGQESGCINNSYDRPQFNPVHPMLLENLTICMSSQHYLGPHYNIHNLYSNFEAVMTYDALKDIRGKRVFILTRASSTGQGAYSAHWTGDIDSSWDMLRMSIPMVLDFGLFGTPFVGADICGFNYDTTQELCTRWYSVGAFYSFMRNHNDHFQVDQDPAAPNLGGVDGPVFKAAKHAIEIRYSILPFLYSLFFRNSLTGEPVLRSVYLNYPKESELKDNDYQFMWGRDLLINPILEEGKDSLDAQFPPGLWYDWADGSVVSDSKTVNTKKLKIPLTEINLSARGGSIIPMHDVKQTTTEQRKDMFKLRVFLDWDEKAEGSLYWDDGDSLNTKEWEEYTHVVFRADKKSLNATPLLSNYKGQDFKHTDGTTFNTMSVKEIRVHGLKNKPSNVKLDGTSIDFDFDANTKTLIVPKTKGQLFASLLKGFTITWSDRSEL